MQFIKHCIIVSSVHDEWLCDTPNLIYVNMEDINTALTFVKKVENVKE